MFATAISKCENRIWIFSLAFLTVLIVVCLIRVQNAFSDATLTWDPPATYDDGTPLTDLAGFKAYYGTTPGNYTHFIDAGDATSLSLSGLADGTYYFAVTAYDKWGNESDYSNEVIKQVSATQWVNLTISVKGPGMVTVAGMICASTSGKTCTFKYRTGSVISLMPISTAGSAFAGWSGGTCTGYGSCRLAVRNDMTIGAEFSPQISGLK